MLELFKKNELGGDRYHHSQTGRGAPPVLVGTGPETRRTWMLALWLGISEDSEMSTGTHEGRG